MPCLTSQRENFCQSIRALYTFRTDFINTNPQAAQAFVNSFFQGLDFLKTKPSEGLQIAAKYLDIQPEEVKTQLEGIRLADLQTNLEMLANPQSNLYLIKTLTASAEFLKNQNQIKTVPDMSRFIDPQFVEALNSNG